MLEEWYEENGIGYNRRFTFRFADCNTRKFGNIFSMMKVLTEIAGEDYEGKNLGHTLLWEHKQCCLISRMSMNIHRYPNFSEKTILRTWERKHKGPFFYRDFEIRTEIGEVIVSSTSLWLLVNPDTREIVRPNELFGGLLPVDETKSDCPECKRIKQKKGMKKLGERPIYYSDLDGNGHVNNASYAKIAVDFLPVEYRMKSVKQFYIDFVAETILGDTITIEGYETENGYAVQGVTGNVYHFGCEFVY